MLFIDGLQDSTPAIGVLIGINTIAEVKRRLQDYERFRALYKPRYVPSTNRPAASTTTTPRTGANQRPYEPPAMNQRPLQPAAEVPSAEQPPRCYNCREYGLMQMICPHPRRPPGACFTCHSTEHVYRDCPSQRAFNNTAAMASTDGAGASIKGEEFLSELKLVSVSIPSVTVGNNAIIMCCALLDTGSPVFFY